MKITLYTNSISPHQLPLMRELVAVYGADNVLYAYAAAESEDRRNLGWKQEPESWCRKANDCMPDIETCDTLLVGGLRPVELMEKRVTVGLRTLYMSERWFKPPIDMLRLLHPKYFLMARRIVRLIRKAHSFTYLPIGVHAAEDMARLCGLFAGDLRCLFRAPKLDFERRPGGRIYIREQGLGNREQDKKYCLDKMRMWGYFVEASRQSSVVGHQCQSQLATNDQQPTTTPPLTTNDYPLTTVKVLWVGRLLKLKRVDTIIRAVGELATHSSTHPLTHSQLSLDIYGTGPEESRLKKLATKYGECIKFYPSVPIDAVRKLMREHDVYVLASNAYEGWGAVVSEALEEGMKVIGTFEAGSSATILPEECLFHAGNWRRLSELLQKNVQTIGVGKWSVRFASEAVIGI